MTVDASAPIMVMDEGGKVFCLMPDEPFFFDPFQLKSVQEVTLHRPGSHEPYQATRLAWVDGTWNDIETPFDDVVTTIARAWEATTNAV